MASKGETRTGLEVGVMLLNKKKEVLLGRHIPRGKKEIKWIMPGGKVNLGEDIFDAAKREALEECGIEVGDMKIISVSRDELSKDDRWITIGFLAKEFSGIPQVLEPDEISRWKWFSLEKPPKPLFPHTRKIIENYKAGRLYEVKL